MNNFFPLPLVAIGLLILVPGCSQPIHPDPPAVGTNSASLHPLQPAEVTIAIAPTNETTAEAPPALDLAAEMAEARPLVQIETGSWKKGGFGTVLLASFRIQNGSRWDIKDVRLLFTLAGDSGTVLDQTESTIFKVIPSKDFIRVHDHNCGFIHQESERCRIQVVGFQFASDQPAISARQEEEQQEQRQRARLESNLRAATAEAERRARMDDATLRFHLERASNGSPSAQCALGKRYLSGDGVPVDTNLALFWLHKSAAQDNPEAQQTLRGLAK